MEIDFNSLNEIGYRAYRECMRVFGNVKTAAKELMVGNYTIYSWHRRGTTPNANTIAIMLKAGCDVDYILLGRRKHAEK